MGFSPESGSYLSHLSDNAARVGKARRWAVVCQQLMGVLEQCLTELILKI
jgi:hypothetical protein